MTRTEERGVEATTPGARRALEAIAASLGSNLTEASRVPWGDSRSSYHVVLADGRAIAARNVTGSGSLQRAQAFVQRSDRLAASGIPVAHPAQIGPGDDASAWILTPWIDGVVGAMALQAPRSSLELAARMGRLADQIAGVDVDRRDSHGPWAGLGELAEAAAGWLAALEVDLLPSTRQEAKKAFDVVVAAWDNDTPWHLGVSHGDFAPVNVIIGLDGNLVVLDLDDVQPGPRLLDVAWWGWVVRYHHPVAWARSWSTFVAAAGLEAGPRLDAAAIAVARLRLLERAATAPDTRVRSQWLQRLGQSTGS